MSEMYAVHFLQEDMCSRNGSEKPWKVGETRTVRGKLVDCEWGYHYSPDWESALKGGFLYGPMACIVRVDDANLHGLKGVTATRTLVEAHDVTRPMRAFAAGEAERALKAWEKRNGKPANPRSWAAVKAAWGASTGKVSANELAVARAAARDAAWGAARDAAWAVARDAAWGAAWDAARAVASKRFAKAMGEATGWWSQ